MTASAMPPLGLMQWSEGTPGSELVTNVHRVESLGYAELWLPEIFGREVLSTCGYLLAKTSRICVSSGIANVYARDADAAAQAANGLAELSGARFRLGLGVSHPVLVEPRGHAWEPPVQKMRKYLARMGEAPILSPRASRPAPVIVAGHGKGLLRVARDLADGAFLFLQPIESVRMAREILGPGKELHVTLRCVLDPNPATARDLARRACAFYIGLPAYHARWGELGYTSADWTGGGSDRLIDAICAWGDAETLRARIAALHAAGATHVALYPCNPDETYTPDNAISMRWHWPLLEALAPGT
ncbi:MAG: LLM class flavin-dependent oxidoreductase [Gammaproteobacteria bacterium]